MKITDLIGKKIILCDGAMGTMMQKYGLVAGEIPELLNFTKPEVIKGIYREYFAAGCDFVTANTFGANRLKTAGCGHTVHEIIGQAIKIAKQAAEEHIVNPDSLAGQKFVALDIAPIGKLMEPTGDLTFSEAYEMFKEQMIAGADGGADFVLFETFTDVYELKAAVLAAKENCDLPIFCSATFQEDGRMLMGTDPATMVHILQDMGIDALGVNCSLGPKQMLPIVKEVLKWSKLPVLVQPNAGLPVVVEGKTVYDVTIGEYVDAMMDMLEAGIAIAGGCCGTTPEYMQALSERIIREEAQHKARGETFPALASDAAQRRAEKAVTAVTSTVKTVVLDGRIRIIGERINPTGKKLLKEALKSGDFAYIENEAIEQVNAGADILDINVGLPEIDEGEAMLSVMKRVSQVVDVPLQIDSADAQVVEAAARICRGKPIINSVNGKEEVMNAIFPIVKKYGACVIALTLDEKGLPKNTEERVAIARRIIAKAAEYGIGRERILVDCLTLTVSAEQNAGKDTLEAIRQVKNLFGVKTTLGASNISFGLPQRKLLNRTFLAMALEAGLDAPITDPLVSDYVDTIRAYETLSGKDVGSKEYIERYGGGDGAAGPSRTGTVSATPGKKTVFSLEEIIIRGYEDRARQATETMLKEKKPLDIVEEIIIPALEKVGKSYEEGKTFLPQLIKSADTVKEAFQVLKAAMEVSGEKICYGRIIVATVQGDIHDIGKNIVRVLLENYGYEVIDLGKDVPIDKIVRTAADQQIQLVGLSALMTTTVVNMEATIRALKEAGLSCKTAVGGAVLTADYAQKIGADFYCKDAMETVRAANHIFKDQS